ncbi:hypothetical protein [Streptomyces sp. NPDC102283]|uniref:hypothetical protein n=1 Tax=Streptomyces sp. NPDC102283 TaxID=3366155 RepID=UPI00381BE45F
MGEDIGHRTQPQSGLAEDREAAHGQQWADLMDSAGDGGTADAAEDGQSRTWELDPQDHQRGDRPVDGYELMARPASFGPQAVATSAFTRPGLLPCRPRDSQLDDQRTELLPRDAGADEVRRRRTDQDGRHDPLNLYGSPRAMTRHGLHLDRPGPVAALHHRNSPS